MKWNFDTAPNNSNFYVCAIKQEGTNGQPVIHIEEAQYDHATNSWYRYGYKKQKWPRNLPEGFEVIAWTKRYMSMADFFSNNDFPSGINDILENKGVTNSSSAPYITVGMIIEFAISETVSINLENDDTGEIIAIQNSANSIPRWFYNTNVIRWYVNNFGELTLCV